LDNGELALFGKVSVDTIAVSLEWDTFEQHNFWRLLNADRVCPDVIQLTPQLLRIINPNGMRCLVSILIPRTSGSGARVDSNAKDPRALAH
jgi:hypothetical protein